MKAAVSHLEQSYGEIWNSIKRKSVTCNSKGDVHDIGKNLVDNTWNNGYDIVDLEYVTPEKLREVILEEKPDFIGLLDY